MKNALCLLIVALLASAAVAQDDVHRTIRFDARDGVSITADLYIAHADLTKPMIVLCHQAGWSRGEYREIAPKLNELGFNCIAIDQRSGGAVNDVSNETLASAKRAKKGTTFVDARSDMIDTLKFVKGTFAHGKLILWGSSYSAALSLKIAGDETDLVDGVLAFAPGEYFERFGQPEDWVQSSASKIQDPAFVTSAKNEYEKWNAIFDAIPSDAKQKFVPTTKGNHGSRALWEKFDDNAAYWSEVKTFLSQFAE
jgi:pimeloyl-ACP methyl ester carboxylesterase